MVVVEVTTVSQQVHRRGPGPSPRWRWIVQYTIPATAHTGSNMRGFWGWHPTGWRP